MTREEFVDNLGNIVKALDTLGVPRADMYFSWDNAHNNGLGHELADYGIPPKHRLPLPRYSPDMHRVIEHAMASVKGRLHELAMAHAHNLTPLMLQDLLRGVFAELDPASIAKDVNSLPLAWKVVRGSRGRSVRDARGKIWACTQGNWLPSKLR